MPVVAETKGCKGVERWERTGRKLGWALLFFFFLSWVFGKVSGVDVDVVLCLLGFWVWDGLCCWWWCWLCGEDLDLLLFEDFDAVLVDVGVVRRGGNGECGVLGEGDEKSLSAISD